MADIPDRDNQPSTSTSGVSILQGLLSKPKNPTSEDGVKDAANHDLLSQTAELEALGISIVDQISLEKNVETAVENAMVAHTRKQKLGILKKEQKHVQMQQKQCQIKCRELESRLSSNKNRFVDPRKVMVLEKDVKAAKQKIQQLNEKEIHLTTKINSAEHNEAELDDVFDLEEDDDDVEIFEDINQNKESHLTKGEKKGPTSAAKNKKAKEDAVKILKNKSQNKELKMKKSQKESMITSGEMTPFGTIVKGASSGVSKNSDKKDSSGLSEFERYLQDQINRQKKMPTAKITTKGSSPTKSSYGIPKKPKKSKEFLGSTKSKESNSVEPKSTKLKNPINKKNLHPKPKKRSNVGSLTSDKESDQNKQPRRPLSESVALEQSDFESCEEFTESDSDYMPSGEESSSELNMNDNYDDSGLATDDHRQEKGEKKAKRKRSKVENDSDTGIKPPPKKQKNQHHLDDGNIDNYLQRIEVWKRDRLLRRHNKILQEEDLDSEDEDENCYEVFEGGFKIPHSIWKKLYKYQKTCVRWLWELHTQGCGGILGDEMGLGKTIQIIAFLVGLSYSRLYSSNSQWRGLGPVLIVAPATVLHQWVKEVHKWWPLFRVAVLHDSGSFVGSASTLIHNINKNCGILITSYTGMRSRLKVLLNYNWHYIILDEGHKIRNPEAQITVAVKRFPTPHRLILSGSPIQNNLKELWSLFDFVFPGKLGTLPVFMSQFAVPITQGGYSNANKLEVQTAFKCACILRDTINPYLLRRMKSDVRDHIDLPDKNEQVLFCGLNDEQRDVYKEYLDSREVHTILKGRMKVFAGLINLRKICNHPDLYTGGPRHEDGGSDLQPETKYGWWGRAGKMRVLHSILRLWSNQTHRVLLFTQSKQMLLILEKFLIEEKYTYLKMDGGTSVGSRQPLIEKYNTDPTIFVFLLTTRVGGLGVNLTGADRIIIYDPDWNPSTDCQARERAWRIGQLRHVTIYRLLTAGTIEEKIYHRQIFKQFITNRVLKDPKQQRFFKSNDLFELFTLTEGLKEKTESASLFAGLNSEIKIDPNKRMSKYDSDEEDGRRNKTKAKSQNSNRKKEVIQVNSEKKIEERTMDSSKEKGKKFKPNLLPMDKVSARTIDLDGMKVVVNNGSIVIKPEIQTDEICDENETENHKICDEVEVVKTEEEDEWKEIPEEGELFDVKQEELSPTDESEAVECDENEAKKLTEDELKKQKMLDLAKMLSKRMGSSKSSFSKASNLKDKSLKSEKKDKKRHSKKEKESHRKEKHKKRKGKKFEGERIEYLVKKSDYLQSTQEEQEAEKLKNQSQDQYVLERLFKSSGVHTAMSHDAIVNSSDSDYLILESEADKIAKEAIKNVRASRAQCYRPSLPKQKEQLFGKKKNSLKISDTKENKPSKKDKKMFGGDHVREPKDEAEADDFSVPQKNSNEGPSGMITSAQLIARIRERNELDSSDEDSDKEVPEYPSLAPKKVPKQIEPEMQEHVDLLADIRNFVAFQAQTDGTASTQEIVDKFQSRLPPDKSHIFKALLKQICDFHKIDGKPGFWSIKSEFK